VSTYVVCLFRAKGQQLLWKKSTTLANSVFVVVVGVVVVCCCLLNEQIIRSIFICHVRVFFFICLLYRSYSSSQYGTQQFYS